MTDGYVLKSSVFSSIHRGDIDMGMVTPHEYRLLKDLSERIDWRIQRVPVADARLVRHGRWMLIEYPYGQKTYICSECKDDDWWNGRYAYGDEHYCPNCGAEMNKES